MTVRVVDTGSHGVIGVTNPAPAILFLTEDAPPQGAVLQCKVTEDALICGSGTVRLEPRGMIFGMEPAPASDELIVGSGGEKWAHTPATLK